jgi:predicted nucleic acid-binding protein
MKIVSNTGPIIGLAKEKGILGNIGSLVDELRTHGYWLSDEVTEVAKRLAGEK